MGKRSPETEARDRTRADAGEAASPPPAGAMRSPGTGAGNNMDKDANYTWTPAQERRRSARRIAALV